ncbi:hypothetical protein AARAC_002666 [Aspergillus arachidicola]|uniref:Uncharacterized protein n=1 Tax=Aspergillus arachidicola TaxID=656916 RepID=A0A2G7FJU5_9EURO|nr:hypothetical protein AARAC_002666 [Aspergillus arachidicola]
MNAVVVNATQINNRIICAGKDAALQIATNNTSRLHNQLMERVLERRLKVQQRAIGKLDHASESSFADIQLLFTETHLKWCGIGMARGPGLSASESVGEYKWWSVLTSQLQSDELGLL